MIEFIKGECMPRILRCFFVLFLYQMSSCDLRAQSFEVGSVELSKAAKEYFVKERKIYITHHSLDPNTPPEANLLSKEEILKRQVGCRETLSQYPAYAENDLKKLIVTGTNDYHTLVLFLYSLVAQRGASANQEFFYTLDRTLEAAKKPIEKAFVQFLAQKKLRIVNLPKLEQEFSNQELENYGRQLIATYPTTFSGYDVETSEQSDSGQVCIKMTHPIADKNVLKPQDVVELKPHVKDAIITYQCNKICISGLAFGQDYEIKLKPGLVSENEQKMTDTFEGHVFIQNRKPMVAFREHGHILSKNGEQVLPVVSTNTERVKASIISIPERNFHSVFSDYKFLNDMTDYAIHDYKNQHGELIWKGTVDLKSKVNQLNTFGIPIPKMFKSKLKSGLYVCHIQDADEESSRYTPTSSTQWFIVSDIGITTLNGPDGMHVIVRSLKTGKAIKGARISVYSKNNKLLHKTKVSGDGIALIRKPLLMGKESNQPLYILVHSKDGKDFNFSLMQTAHHDLKDRGDKGRELSEKDEVYIYSDRGIYRPGETINITAMVRDKYRKAVDNVPLTFVVYQANGSEYVRKISKSSDLGAHTFSIKTSRSDGSGEWRVEVYADPNAPRLASHSVIVSDFVPALLEGEIETNAILYSGEQTQTEMLNVRYLYGAKAWGLKATSTIRLVHSTCPFEQWKSYDFGLVDRPFANQYVDKVTLITNENGQAKVDFSLESPTDYYGMVAVENVIEVTDISGRLKQITKTTPYWHQDFAIGIEPGFKENAPYKGEALFNIIAIDKEGQLIDRSQVKYTLFAEETQYVWFKSGGQWRYQPVVSNTKIDSGTINLTKASNAILKTNVQVGRYRLVVEDPKTKIASSIRFNAGWTYDDASKSSPDKVTMILDKEEYAPGSVARVTIKPPYAGDLMLFSADKELKLLTAKSIPKEGIEMQIKLGKRGIRAPGAYLYATVFKPGGRKGELADRAIGMSWINVDKSSHQLAIELEAPEKVSSHSSNIVSVYLPEKPKQAYVQIIAVDEGVLQITDYKTPDPLGFFLSRRAFNYSVRDDYGKIISPNGAKETSFNVGGGADDSTMATLDLPMPSVKILSLYSGPVELDSHGKAVISLDFPEFSGKVRLMAVAWSEEKMGSSKRDIIVQDPFVTMVSTPRFLSSGDDAIGSIFIHNIEGEEGEYSISTETTGAIHLSQIPAKMTFAQNEQHKIPFNIHAHDVGEASISIKIVGPKGNVYTRTVNLGVRHDKVTEIHQKYFALKPDQSFVPPTSLMEYFDPGYTLKMLVNQFLPVPIHDITTTLLDYPWRCLEQTVSQGYAVLYSKADLSSTIDHLKAMQGFHGMFKLWPSGYQNNEWLTGYAYGFLKEAKQTGSFVLSTHKSIKQKTYGSDNNYISRNALCYYHYLLAKNGERSISHLRYFAHTQKKNIHLSSMAMAHLGAAFAYHGQEELANKWFDKAIQDTLNSKDRKNSFYHNDLPYFFSPLMEAIEVARIMIEVSESSPQLPKLFNQIAHLVNQKRYFSTIEQASFLRLSQLLKAKALPYTLKIGGQEVSKKTGTIVLDGEKQVQNVGDVPVWVNVTAIGQAKGEAKPKSAGLSLSRKILTMQGEKAPEPLVLGESYIVVLSGAVLDNDRHNALILDLLPAGLEVIVDNVQLHNLSDEVNKVIETLSLPTHAEARDDRFMAVLDLGRLSKFKICYIAHAVSAGRFSHPLSRIEDMYRPDIRAIGDGKSKVMISER